ncbi:MAG: hypothetical protein PUF62_10865 [Bacteroidales bacterium]|nr:hypothetical protein [Bacteroidales bacterium]
MDAFDLFKSKYLDAKLRFLNLVEMDRQFSEIAEDDNCDPSEKERHERYRKERWESFINILHAADMLVGYVASRATKITNQKGYFCFFQGYNDIDDIAKPEFVFGFNFMAMPDLDKLEEEHPSLSNLCSQIRFGSITVSEVESALYKESIPHSDIMVLGEYSDNDLMECSLDELSDVLITEGNGLLQEFLQSKQ